MGHGAPCTSNWPGGLRSAAEEGQSHVQSNGNSFLSADPQKAKYVESVKRVQPSHTDGRRVILY